MRLECELSQRLASPLPELTIGVAITSGRNGPPIAWNYGNFSELEQQDAGTGLHIDGPRTGVHVATRAVRRFVTMAEQAPHPLVQRSGNVAALMAPGSRT